MGVLVAVDSKKDKSLKTEFPLKRRKINHVVVVITALITSLLILANIGSAKIAYADLGTFGVYHFPPSVLFFPFVFLLTDITTEFYGFITCRKIIWASLLGLMGFIFLLQVCIKLPASPSWEGQEAFANILGQTLRIFIASATAFLVGDLLNAWVLSKLKELTSGKIFALRAIGSTMVGAFADSLLFVSIAYSGKLSSDIMINMIFTETLVKVGGETLILPITLLIIYILRKRAREKPEYEYTSAINPYSITDNVKEAG